MFAPNRVITNKTTCSRYYMLYDSGWECNDDCNMKGPRYSGCKDGSCPGMQSNCATTNGSTGNYMEYKFGAYDGADAGRCDRDGGAGCRGQGIVNRGGDDFRFEEEMQTEWVRYEICFDHNVSESQYNAAGWNGKLGSWPGANRLYFRAKLVGLTSGKVGTYGPAYGPNPVTYVTTGSTNKIWDTGLGSRSPSYSHSSGGAWAGYIMVAEKATSDPTYWIGAAAEVEGASGDGTASIPNPATPTPTPAPTPTAIPNAGDGGTDPTPNPDMPAPTATPVSGGTDGGSGGQEVVGADFGCPGSANPDPAILYCDDFDDGIPISEKWNAYNPGSNSFVLVSGVGVAGSTAMRASFESGQVNAGTFSIGLGQLPAFYTGGGENWQHVIEPESKFREIYFRQYLKMGVGWSGIPRKYSRVRVLSDPQPGDSVHPTAFQGHFWQQINTNNGGTVGALYWNNSNGVDENGTVIDTGNNSNASVWIAQTRGSTAIFQDYPQGSEWICIEAHLKLNDPGLSNGIEEFWVNDQLEARRTDQNHVGIYTAYGLNQVIFDNYWNGGSPQYNELYRDNMVISTERIGCLSDSELIGESGDGSLGKPGTPYVIGQ